mmetsp:Transcript_56372/g.175264  ORF Transcript_56372/g.175264 Transcript_56372/m.175264 type:complete len:104 (-) Transcript_56372:3-314(-)
MIFNEADSFRGMSFLGTASNAGLREECQKRKQAGYNSGMGAIFVKLAHITRPQGTAMLAAVQSTTTSASASQSVAAATATTTQAATTQTPAPDAAAPPTTAQA